MGRLSRDARGPLTLAKARGPVTQKQGKATPVIILITWWMQELLQSMIHRRLNLGACILRIVSPSNLYSCSVLHPINSIEIVKAAILGGLSPCLLLTGEVFIAEFQPSYPGLPESVQDAMRENLSAISGSESLNPPP